MIRRIRRKFLFLIFNENYLGRPWDLKAMKSSGALPGIKVFS